MNRETFISEVEKSQKALRRFLTALCTGDSQLADDIAQETLIKAYLSCDDITDTSKFNAWVYKIAYNTFLNQKRRERKSVGYEEIENLKSENVSDDAFKYQSLYLALENLPDKERTGILLYYLENYSVKEIASIVDSTPDAVKQHLSRGRKHLREILEND